MLVDPTRVVTQILVHLLKNNYPSNNKLYKCLLFQNVINKKYNDLYILWN
jgi:hypothetical protein